LVPGSPTFANNITAKINVKIGAFFAIPPKSFIVLNPVQICEREGKWIVPCEEVYQKRKI
jgi:hypothetical protein